MFSRWTEISCVAVEEQKNKHGRAVLRLGKDWTHVSERRAGGPREILATNYNNALLKRVTRHTTQAEGLERQAGFTKGKHGMVNLEMM